jgi:short-subunit dehydrogenase
MRFPSDDRDTMEQMATSDIGDGSVLLLGGRSEIGLEVARGLAPGRRVILAARRSGDLATETQSIRAAGATSVDVVEFDADDTEQHTAVIDDIVTRYGPIAVAILAFGILGDQATAERDPAHALAVIQTDFVAQVSVLTVLANRMRSVGSGRIVVFSSVAGVRVRRANYVYGSAKAGLDGFASGLGDALHGTGVSVLVVRPGFVIGRMTEGMSPAPMSSTPSQVASATVEALHRGRSSVWVPRALRPAFFVARLVPQALWRRMPR